MKEKRFAANVNRKQVGRCTDLGLALEDVLGLALASMKRIAPDLGL